MRLIALLPLLVILNLILETLQGVLQPEVPDSVLPYRNNENAVGKYTFTFKMSSPVPSSPRITIDFPGIYPKLLNNVDNCQGSVFIGLTNEREIFGCTVFGNQVTFDISTQWSELDSGNIVVEVFDIVNPASVAGKSTGYFRIRTWSGIDIVIDSNLAFDAIAFSPAYTLFSSVSIKNDGANIAGYTTNYILTFTTAYNYPAGTWFRFKFADGFDFQAPLECYVVDLKAPSGNLPCYNDGSVLVMKGLQQALPAGTYRIKMRNIINPKIATSTGTGPFLFESLKEGVYTVIEYFDTLAGVVIKPGTVTDVTVVGFPLVQNLFVDYTIKYRPANAVPRGGMFNMQFPPDFVGGIDTTCRVTLGLLPADDKGIVCVTDGIRDIWISNFKDFVPQYVEVKCFAYNPPVGGETANFQVRTFTTTAKTQMIDENKMAGTVVISEIQKPNFMQIDFYVKHVNCSFFQFCPINFRYFPYPNQTLTSSPTTSSTPAPAFSAINMQMPIWWMTMNGGRTSTYPECLFGDVPTASCYQREHVVSIITPKTQPYGACELPVTINNVRVSPIPGKFPFRIWSFKDGYKYHDKPTEGFTMGAGNATAWKTPPIEQDTYIMDIPPTGIAVLQTWNSASQAEDLDNLFHFRSNVHPFLFAWSGTISIVITHVEVSLEDKAEWPQYAGQSLISDNSWKEIACKLYQSAAATGYQAGWLDSRSLRCMMKTGSYSTKDPTVIQVTGFDSNIDKGNYYEMFIPDMQFCKTVGRQCKVNYTYTMNEDPVFPYTISQREQSLGTVLPKEPTTVNAATGSNWGATSRSSTRCETTTLTVLLKVDARILKNDYIIIKKNIDHWNLDFLQPYSYSITATGYAGGTMYPVLNFEKNQEYMIHRFTADVIPPSSNLITFTVSDQVTSPYIYDTAVPNAGVAWIDVVLWTQKVKQVKGRAKPTSPVDRDNGIKNNGVDKADLYGPQPWLHNNWYVPHRINMRTCMEVPDVGEVVINFANTKSPSDTSPLPTVPLSVCRVWLPVIKRKANETHVSCTYNPSTKALTLKNFDTILKRTSFRVNWYYEIGNTGMGDVAFRYTSYNQSQTVAASKMDYYGNGVATISSTGFSGQLKAISWEYLGHYEYKWELYKGSIGKFVFEIEVGHGMIWETGESQYFVFTTHFSVIHINGNLECRYAEKQTDGSWGHHFPSVACWPVTNALTTVITMKLHPYQDIAANKRYQIFIDTRSTDTDDGLTFTRNGIFSINVESFVGGVKQRGGKQRFEVFGPRIPEFVVWSSNKIAGEPAHLTYYADFMNGVSIVSSNPNLTVFNNIMLYFETALGTSSYPIDLGLGYPDQSVIPCNLLLGVPYWTNNFTATCTLYYGYSGAPARIKIEGFLDFSCRTFRVDIPLVVNPTATGIVPRTWLKVLETTVAGGVKSVDVRYEGRYYELNTTWSRNTTRYPRLDMTYSTPITMTTTTLNTVATLSLPFNANNNLEAKDFVLIKFPIFWPTPWAIDFNDCNTNVYMERCYSIRNDQQNAHFVYFQTKGLSNGATLKFTLPSSRAVIPPTNATTVFFEMYVFRHTRLIAKHKYTGMALTMFIADPIVPTINCLPTTPIQSTSNEYIVAFNLPHNLLDKSEIRIDYVDYDIDANPNCTSTTNSMLTGTIYCSVLPPTDTFVSVVGFNAIAKTSKVEIKVPLLNRLANGLNRKWRIRTYYLRGGYYYVNGDSGLIDHVNTCKVVAVPAVVNVPWATWFHKFQRTRSTQYGPLVFYFESAFTLTKSTVGDYILIHLPIAFTFAKAEKVASWDMHYPYLWDFKTTSTEHQIKIWAPKTLDVDAATRYMVNITTLNGLNNVNGILYPDQISSHYIASIEVFKGGSRVEVGDAKVFVFKPNFAKFEAKSYLINSNNKASFKLSFYPPTSETYSGSVGLRFKLPTATYKYRQRINLFSDDAGTGLSDGSAINCYLIQAVGKALVNTQCQFYKGSQDLGTPATVTMKITGSLAVASLYYAVFDGFQHPAVGADDKNVEPSLEFLTAAGAHTATGIDYDYTIVEDNTFTTQNNFAPPIWDSSVVGQANIGFSINFMSPVPLSSYQASNGIGWADYLIIEFPVGYVIRYFVNTVAKVSSGPGSSASVDTPVEFSGGNRWVIWRPNINILASTMYTLRVSNIDQAMSLPPVPVFKVFVVQDRELKSIINYLPITTFAATALTPADITFVGDEVAVGSVPKAKYQRWLLTIKHPLQTVPAGAVIQIILPSTLTVIDDHCYNHATSTLKNPSGQDITIFCKWESATSSFIVSNLDTSPTSDLIKLLFYATSENASPGSGSSAPLVIKFYRDATRQFQLLQGSVASPSIAAYNGFNQLMVVNLEDNIPDVVRAGESTAFEFYVTLPASYTATTILTLTIPTAAGASVPANSYLECFFGSIESKECVVTSVSPLKITILSPHDPALTPGTKYYVRVRTRCGSAGQSGLTFANQGVYTATVTDGTVTSNIDFEVFDINFNYIQPTVMHSNAGQSNGLSFRFKTTVNIPATGAIRLKLGKLTRGGSYQIWPSLGIPGQTYSSKCMSVTTTTLVPTSAANGLTCTYFEDANYVIFEISDFNSIAAPNDVEFVIYDLINPAVAHDNAHVDAVIETVDGASNILNQGVLFDVFSPVVQAVVTPSAIGGFSRSVDTFGTPGVSYTFSATVSPALSINDQVVFEFSNSYYFSAGSPSNCNAASTQGTYRFIGKYVVFRPTAGISGPVTFCFSGATNPTTNDPTPVKFIAVYNRAFQKIQPYNVPGFTLGTGTLTATASALNLNAGSKYSVTIDTTTALPAGGSIAVRFPATYSVEGISVVSGFPAGTTAYVDSTVSGFSIAVITTPTAWSKSANGNAVFDIFVKNPSSSGSYSLIAYGYQIYSSSTSLTQFSTNSVPFVIANVGSLTCYLDSTTAFSTGPSTTLSLNVMMPTSTTKTFTAGSNTGYDMFMVDNGAGAACNGMPVYVTPSVSLLLPSATLYHLTIQKANLPNAITITGTTVSLVLKTTGTISVDFGNHDLKDLGTGLSNGAFMPCHLEVAGIVRESVCRLRIGTMYQSPGVTVNFFSPIIIASAISLTISKFSNPATARKIEVRLRYYETTYGQRTVDLMAYVPSLFTIADSPTYVVKSAAYVLSPNIAQSTVATATFALTATETGKTGLLFGPSFINNELSFPATGSVTDSFDGAQFAYKSITATSFAVTNWPLPTMATLASIYSIVAVDTVTKQAISLTRFSGTTVDACTPSVTITATSKNDVSGSTTYNIKWTSACDFTRYSAVNIRPAAYVSAVAVVSSNLNSAAGSIVGSYKVRGSGNYIVIDSYDYIPAGSVDIDVTIQQTYTAGSSTGDFFVSLNSLNIATAAPVTAIVSPAVSKFAERYRSYLPSFTPAVINSNGYLSFFFKSVQAIASTDYITITQATAGFASQIPYLRCKFTQIGAVDEVFLSAACSYSNVNKQFTIAMPKVKALSNTFTYRLDIFYVAESVFGFPYPGASSSFPFDVRLLNSGGTVKEYFVTALENTRDVPSTNCARNFLSNSGYKNVFMVGFTPSITVPAANGFVEVRFPNSVYSQGIIANSFNKLAGLSYYNGQAILCKAFTVSGSTKSAWGGLTNCVVSYGGVGSIHRYVAVKITFGSALAAATKYEFDLYGIDNPTNTELHHLSVVAGVDAAGVRDYYQSFRDPFQLYSVTPAAATVDSTIAMPAVTPTIIQSATSFNLPINTAAPFQLKTNVNHIRLIYNADMHRISPAATNFEGFDVNDGLAYFYTTTATTTNFNLALSGMSTPSDARTFVSSFKAQLIGQKVVKREVPYSPGSNTFVAIPYTSATITASYKSIKSNDKAPGQVSLTFSKVLSMTGSIELTFPNMASVDAPCNENTAIIGANFKCEAVSATQLRISGFSRDIQVGEVITINFRVFASSATTGQVCARAFNDYAAPPTALVAPVQLLTCDSFTYQSNSGIAWFEARTPTTISRVQATQRAMMTFLVNFSPMAPRLVSTVKISDTGSNFANLETKDFECFFTIKTDLVAKSCVYTGSTKTWDIKVPRSTDLTGWVTITVVPTRQNIEFPTRTEGVQVPNLGGIYPLTLAAYNGGGTLLFNSPEITVNLPPPHFTGYFFNSYLIQKDGYSTFHLKIKPQTAVSAAPNGVIKIDFKIKDRYALNVFIADIGTDVLNGAAYDCPGTGFVAKCRLFLGNAATPASILVDPQTSLTPAGVYEIDFPALLNPFLNMTEVLLEVTSQNLVSGNWITANTEHTDVFVAQELIITPTPLPALNWPDKQTGAPNTVTFTFTLDPTVGPLKVGGTNSMDRIMIKVDRAEIDILNDQAVAGKILNCGPYTIKIFDSKDMIELSAATQIAAGATVSITCSNYLFQQYVIRGGVKWTIELWIDGTVAQAFQYAATTAIPHILPIKTTMISAITPEISSFDTYTFIVKPFNYMPEGSRFEIYFDQAFSSASNCEIVSGLNGGICQIIQNVGGYDHIKISLYKLWNPDVDPQIKITIDMVSPAAAGSYSFKFVSYWQEFTNPALEDKIDEDTIGTINYIGYVPFVYLSLDKMYQWAGERCPHQYWEGVVSFKLVLVETINYPDFIVVNDWTWTNGQDWERNTVDPFEIWEVLCYVDSTATLFSAKSEKCLLPGYGSTGNRLIMMVPEELPFTPTNNYVIKVDFHGRLDRGFSQTNDPSYKYYSYMYGTNDASGYAQIAAQSSAPFSYRPRACFFGTKDYDSTNWNQFHNHSLEIRDYSGISYSRISNTRPTSRFQALYSTHNEIKAVSQKHLGWDLLVNVNDTSEVACQYWHADVQLAIPGIKSAYDIKCQVWNVEPSYISPSYGATLSTYSVLTMTNFTNTNYGDISFHYGYALVKNHQVLPMKTPRDGDFVDGNRNTFAHIIVQSQTEYEDGTWLDQNRVVKWRHIQQINPVVNDPSITTASGVAFTWPQFGMIHLTWTLTLTPLVSTSGRTWVYWELEDPWWHLNRNLTHGSRFCRNDGTSNDALCNQYGIPARWSIWPVNGVSTGSATVLQHFGLMESPGFAIGGGAPRITKPIRVYIANNHNLVKIQTGEARVLERVPYYIFESDDAANPTGKDIMYRIGIWSVDTFENNTNTIRLWITNEFTVIGPNCKILFGFTRTNFNKLAPADGPQCLIIPNDPDNDSPTPGQYHRVEFYNLYRWSRRSFDQYESWMIFEIKLKNPFANKWPKASAMKGYWNNRVWPLLNDSRYNYRIGIEHDQGRAWVGDSATTLAHYFRVVRNRKTFEERRQKAGEWAELHMRLYPKNDYPADISKVEIQIPQSYDIPNGGTKICEVGHNYHTDLAGQFCEISNERMIQVRTNQNFGLLKRCTIVRITTEKSVKNLNGFQAPATTAIEAYGLNLYIGSKRIEYTSNSGTPEPTKLIPFSTLNITANVIEIAKESTLNVSFHAGRAIRSGYDTDDKITDALKKQPQGEIWLKFNTRDTYTSSNNGFPKDLGYPNPPNDGVNPYQVPCQPFKNLVPRAGQAITCTVTPQSVVNYYLPVVMIIKNFQLIPEGQLDIELHIMQLNWILNTNNLGWIEFSVYERYGDGSLEKTYDDVRINLGALSSGGVTQTSFGSSSIYNPVFTPNFVGARINLNIRALTPIPLYQYDTFEVTMPAMMILPRAEDISAVFKVTPSNVAIPPYVVTSTVVVYPSINRVNFILPRSTAIYGCTVAKPCDVTILTAGFRHIPYATSANLVMIVRIINKLTVVQNNRYYQIAPPTVPPFNSILATISSQFSGDIYVQYDFLFSPSYDYPSGTVISVVMDWTKYRQIDKSNPPATCKTNFMNVTKSCVISEALITITLNGTLPEGISADITAIGVKNPTFVGTTSAGDIYIQAVHPSGFLINKANTNTLTYKSQKNVDTIIFTIELSSYYSEVSSDYRFILQNTNTLPPKGILNIQMPRAWSQLLKSDIRVTSIVAGFTKEKLIFSQTAIRQPSDNILLQIIPEFSWPSKQKLIINLDTIINPKGISTTEPFKIYTQYDSVLIDQSDFNDPSSTITLKPYNPKIVVWKSDFTPQNEGEIATYTFLVSCQEFIPSGSKLQFTFPTNYADILTTYPLTISCSSPNYAIGTCTASSRSLTIPLLQDMPADDQISLSVLGIANPNYGTINFVDVSILDSNNNVVQFINDAFSIDTIVGATYARLASVSASKNQILIKSDYEECLEITGDIPLGSKILLDFPKQFDMRKDTYPCYKGSNHDNSVLAYPGSVLTCTVYKNLKRIEIFGQTNAFTYTGTTPKKICYKIGDLENSKDTGESFHFNIRVFDTKGKRILYKSAGILNYPSTLSYQRTGLRIFVDSIPDIPIGTMSNDIQVTLEKPVPYDITLIPSCPNVQFIPPRIVFPFYEGQTQTFRINPDISTAAPGTYSISWVKEEDTTITRFSEMVDTYFKVTAQPDYRQLKLTVSQSVYRASVGASSMPIYVYLSHPASTPMTLFYKTKKPFQPEFVKFDPESVTFQPGEKVKVLTYKTLNGAVSGLIDLQLQPEFKDIYYLPTPEINFEIEDIDKQPPSIEEFKITDLQMKSMSMRVSCDESSKVYYICSIKGTLPPSVDELRNATLRSLSMNRPRTTEIQGSSYANITSQTKSYIYYDTYLNLTDLEPDREYTMFMMPEDLSGNPGEIKSLTFKTDKVPAPIKFTLKSSQQIPDDKLLQALSLVSGLTTDKIVITYRPSFSSIPTSETEVTDVLNRENLQYEFMIMPDATIDGKSPYDYLKKIEDDKETLFDELPSLDKNQMISETGREVGFEKQKFTYVPQMIEVSNFHALFNVSLFYSGTVYGIILPASEATPSAVQIKDGLTSINRQVLNKYYSKVGIKVDASKSYKINPSGLLNFTFLYHSSNYVAYFIGDRETLSTPVLMPDTEVLAVPLKTLREIFKVEDSVLELRAVSNVNHISTSIMLLLALLLAFDR